MTFSRVLGDLISKKYLEKCLEKYLEKIVLSCSVDSTV